MTTRRHLLKFCGAAILVSGAGLGYFAQTRQPEKALEPWVLDADRFNDPRVKALAYAVLAPNPHNRQPWLVDLLGDDEIYVFCDLNRRLPETDPYDRQITIGLGCFLELYRMALAKFGWRATIDQFLNGVPHGRLDDRMVARIIISPDANLPSDPLLPFVSKRRTNKEAYDTSRTIPSAVYTQLISHQSSTAKIGGTLDPLRVKNLRGLTWRGHKAESYTPRTMQESIDLMRIGRAEIEAQPDGIDLGGFGLEMLANLGVLTRKQLSDPDSEAFSQGMDMYRKLMFSAMGYVWIETPGNTRADQLEAGRLWVRMNLNATRLGLSIHPLSQTLQEYSEMSDLYQELHKKLAVKAPARIQMFARIGYGPKVAPSPRWPAESRIIGAA
jgi:hypothetical protein